MPNTIIDVVATSGGPSVETITAEEGGVTTNDVRVVIREGVSTNDAHQTLKSIAAALIGDNIKLS
jgi:hypothetical protein